MKYRKALVLSVFLIAVFVASAFFVNYWQNRPVGTPTPSLFPSEEPSSPPTIAPSGTPVLTATPAPTKTPTRTSTPTLRPSVSPSPTRTTPMITPSALPTTSPITLYPGEVRQYQGQNLSPIASVYENAIAGTQYINKADYELSVFGLVNRTLQLSYEQTLNHQLYQKVVIIYCVEGWNATVLWEGVLVKDLFQDATPNSSANTVIFYASDGYTTALPLSYVTSNDIILAYKMNGVVIPPERGFPFQLVAEDKYGYKWIKWVTGIELSDDPYYLGYWESRGFSNDATR
jgi:DMSO/TMAO reductase YedYZ molybdopterin-dependent catalytic subunit